MSNVIDLVDDEQPVRTVLNSAMPSYIRKLSPLEKLKKMKQLKEAKKGKDSTVPETDAQLNDDEPFVLLDEGITPRLVCMAKTLVEPSSSHLEDDTLQCIPLSPLALHKPESKNDVIERIKKNAKPFVDAAKTKKKELSLIQQEIAHLESDIGGFIKKTLEDCGLSYDIDLVVYGVGYTKAYYENDIHSVYAFIERVFACQSDALRIADMFRQKISKEGKYTVDKRILCIPFIIHRNTRISNLLMILKHIETRVDYEEEKKKGQLNAVLKPIPIPLHIYKKTSCIPSSS